MAEIDISKSKPQRFVSPSDLPPRNALGFGPPKASFTFSEGKTILFVTIDPTRKSAFVRRKEKADRITAPAFLVALVKAVPYRIHTVLTPICSTCDAGGAASSIG